MSIKIFRSHDSNRAAATEDSLPNLRPYGAGLVMFSACKWAGYKVGKGKTFRAKSCLILHILFPLI
jgi:hypothetical protein